MAADGNAGAADLTAARSLAVNKAAAFIGGMKKGQFDVPGELARRWLREPNPNGRSSADVLVPWLNGLDMTRRPQDMWIVDFGPDRSQTDASLFPEPYAHVLQHVKPARDEVRNELEKRNWWLHARSAPELRNATAGIPRSFVTARVAKHRLFVWLRPPVVVDGQLVVFARADDATFGVLHSRLHELWSLRMCTWMGKGNDPRYTPTTCFETFPFPADLAPPVRAHAEAIARAARRLVDLREAWLNPPEWSERVPEVVPLGMDHSPYPQRIVAKAGFEKELARRTLTNLYNQRPAWLAQAHAALDAAVAAAYGWADWNPALADDEILRRLLALNLERAGAQR